MVTATVVYNTDTVIDVEEFRKHLDPCNGADDGVYMAQVILL